MIEEGANQLYAVGVDERRELLVKAGFSSDSNRIWTHPDGRAIGEGVILALTDSAFLRYLGNEALARGSRQ